HVAYQDYGNSDKATVKKFPPFTWNGSWDHAGSPDSTDNVVINSNTEPASFSCASLYIDSSFALNTGTNKTVTIYGGLVNNGNGVTGQGTLKFTKDGTAELLGDTLEHEGTIVVESGCTLNTNNKLRLTSDATNTGRIGESDGTINGNVYVQRYMPGKRCFRFYGHPFSSSIALSQLTDEIDITGSGGSTNGFTTTQSNNPSAFWFDVTAADTSTTGANPGWTAFTSATSADWDQYELLRLLVRGAKGEGLSGGAYTPSAATFEGVGTVNQGTQVVTLTKGSNTTFVGCGNPFPSPVNMQNVARGSNVGANYYAWDATSGVSGAYVTNAWTLSYNLPAYSAFFTTVSANSNNTLTFEEQDKVATGAGLFKTTGPNDWVELYIYDSTTKWDRLLINLNSNGMEVEDQLDGKKLYNPNLDFFTLSKDDVRLAVDVRPYDDGKSIPLGLTAYNRYNKYVIRTGMFNVPAGTKLILHDKYLNTQQELKQGFEYWFDVTTDSLSQGNRRFEINMVGKPTGVIVAGNTTPDMQLIPNPAHKEVKVSFKAIEGVGTLQLTSITGQVVYRSIVTEGTGSMNIQLDKIPAGMYIVTLKSKNASFTQKLIKE
ncbi:MAG: T9SS type A sorting domain-containing protein, partial [Chitinophagaceae bacterium]|nr:T9SS type A sorting domain-containing protein [Chitinophagaceae bacterium]